MFPFFSLERFVYSWVTKGRVGRAGIGSAWQERKLSISVVVNYPLLMAWSSIMFYFSIEVHIPWRIHGAAIYGAPWIPSTKTPVMLAYIYHTWILWVWDMVACQCCSDRSVFFFTYARLFCIALAAQLCQVTAGLQRGDDAPSPPEVLWADEESTIPIGSMYGICEWWFYGGLMVIKW